jgi:NAD(P) transhydrogenase subunit alpha
MAAGDTSTSWGNTLLGVLAVAFAMINVVGGYWVTDRMLAMFRSKGRKDH